MKPLGLIVEKEDKELRDLDNISGGRQSKRNFALSSIGGTSRLTPLEVKNEGHPRRRKKQDEDLKGSMQKAGPHSGKKVCLVTLMTAATAESKTWKSGYNSSDERSDKSLLKLLFLHLKLHLDFSNLKLLFYSDSFDQPRRFS